MTQPSQWVAGNKTLLLDANTPAATIVSGSMAVFAIPRGEEPGERIYLFSLAAGNSLWPVSLPEGAAGWELLCVPLEATCLNAPDRKPLFALEDWLGKLGEALLRIAPRSPAENCLKPEPGRTLELTPGRRVAVDRGLVRLDLLTGSGLLNNTVCCESGSIVLVPGLCLEAATDAKWRAHESAGTEVLKATIRLTTHLLMEALERANEHRAADEQARFDARIEANNRIAGTAFGAVAGLTGRKTAHATQSTDDPHFEVVRAVAQALGIVIRPARAPGGRYDATRELAHANGLRCRSVALNGKWWTHDNGPLIAQRHDGCPVALLRARRTYALWDPLTGLRTKVTAGSAATLGPVAHMLYRPLPDRPTPRTMLAHVLRDRRRDVRTMLLSGAAAALLAMAAPQGLSVLITQAIPDADTNAIWQTGAGLTAAALGSAVFLLVQAFAIVRLQDSAFLGLQAGVWDHLLKLSPTFFRRFTSGELRARADAATRMLQVLNADGLRSVLAAGCSFVSLAIVFWYSPALALIALAAGGLFALRIWLSMRSILKVQLEWQRADELLSGLVLQAVSAASKLRVAGATSRVFSHWLSQYSQKQSLSLELQRRKDVLRLFDLVFPGLAITAIFLYQLLHPLALGPFLASTAAIMLFLTALAAAGDALSGFALAGTLWQRLSTILEATPEADASKAHPGILRGEVSAENLTFRYRQDGPMILDGVSIHANPGECIALTGPSGCGKSTLLNLLLRFETPHSGGIYFDGRDLSGLNIAAVRRQIGVVTQDGRIMSGSLFENICCGGANAMEDAWEAASAAGLAADIEAMPMGMHTVVAENGSNLSGGQRQRVLIARALILKPSILIFDEATSALDNRTQAIVTESLKHLKATRILVAHRLSTLRHADRIYLLEKGRIVQQGTFRELASAEGMFARLVSRQRA